MQPTRVWIIDDNAPDVFLIELGLRRTNRQFDLTVMNDGEGAINGIAQCESGKVSTPHIVFLDLHLPKISGIEVLEAIRKSPQLERVCVVMFRNGTPFQTDLAVDRWAQKYSALEKFLEEIEKIIREMIPHCQESG